MCKTGEGDPGRCVAAACALELNKQEVPWIKACEINTERLRLWERKSGLPTEDSDVISQLYMIGPTLR